MAEYMLTASHQKLVEANLTLVEIILRVHIRPNENIRGMEFEELYQCGCLALCKAAATYDGRTQFQTYASHVIRNAMVDQCRTAQKNHARGLSYDSSADKENDAYLEMFSDDSNVEDDVLAGELRTLLREAKRTHKGAVLKGIEAIELKLKGYSGAEIAEMYGVKNNNVTNWISKANAALRKEHPEYCVV